jgi:hypothetical protein
VPPAGGRAVAALRWALWPVGLALILLRAPEAIVPPAAFLPLAAAYVAGAAWLVAPRSARAPAGSAAQWLIGGGVVIFSLAGLSGAPTAEHPGAMVANTTALLLAGLCLAGHPSRRRWRTRRGRPTAT